MSTSERQVIDKIAKLEEGISGIEDSYSFAQNPSGRPNPPSVLHFSPGFLCETEAYHNKWKNSVIVKSYLLVSPRDAYGGKLSSIESSVIPFGKLWREKFQDSSTLSTIFRDLPNTISFGLSGADYRTDIEHNGVKWVGWEFTFDIQYDGEMMAKAMFVNVTEYGALGDGVTDDTSAIEEAIQHAIDLGGAIVYFPSGTYLCQINMTGLNNIILRGTGAGSILSLASLSSPALTIQNSTDVAIEHLKFDGRNSDGATATTTYFKTITNIIIQHCIFDDCTTRAVNFPATTGGTINTNVIVSQCIFSSMSLDAIYVGESSGTYIINNDINDAPDVAIDTGESKYNTLVVGNIIRSCNGGIYSMGTGDTTIVSNNELLECSGTGIRISGDEGAIPAGFRQRWIATNNTLVGSGLGSVGFRSDAHNGILANNLFNGFGANVIRVAASGINVKDNFIDTPLANYGLTIASPLVNVTGNVFKNSASTGGCSATESNVTFQNNVFYGGIGIRITSSSGHNISSNTFYDIRSGIELQATCNCHVGGNVHINSVFNSDIVESSNSASNMIRNNVVRNEFSITRLGNSTSIIGNVNFPTERSGTQNLGSSSNSVAVTHGLALTPTLQDIVISPTSQLGQVTSFWVSNPTATQFTINTNASPGDAGTSFAWLANMIQ